MPKVDLPRELHRRAKKRQREYREKGIVKTIFECAAEIQAETQIDTFTRMFDQFIPPRPRKDDRSREERDRSDDKRAGWFWQ